MIRTIVFDFGNVVGFFDHFRALEKLTPFTDLTPREMYDSVFGGELEDQIETGQLTPPEYLAQVQKLWRLRCDLDILVEAVSNIFTPNPEVCDLLPKLSARYRLLLGSNTNEVHAQRFLSQFADHLSHFHTLVLSHRIGTRKPRPDFFRHCEQHALGQPAECLFIDDLHANVEGAKACGWQGIVYRPSNDLEAEINRLAES